MQCYKILAKKKDYEAELSFLFSSYLCFFIYEKMPAYLI